MISKTKIWILRILINLVFGLLLFAILSSADSEDNISETDPTVELEPVVVTATRTPQHLKDTLRLHPQPQNRTHCRTPGPGLRFLG